MPFSLQTRLRQALTQVMEVANPVQVIFNQHLPMCHGYGKPNTSHEKVPKGKEGKNRTLFP